MEQLVEGVGDGTSFVRRCVNWSNGSLFRVLVEGVKRIGNAASPKVSRPTGIKLGTMLSVNQIIVSTREAASLDREYGAESPLNTGGTGMRDGDANVYGERLWAFVRKHLFLLKMQRSSELWQVDLGILSFLWFFWLEELNCTSARSYWKLDNYIEWLKQLAEMVCAAIWLCEGHQSVCFQDNDEVISI